MSKRSVGIIGTGSYLPEQIRTNNDLEKMVETSDEWITTRTGIKERRIVSTDMATSDLCFLAGQKALDKAGLSPGQIDMVIVATVTPDMAFPATACLVQERLGASNAAAFDLEAGCSGFMYGLTIAGQFVGSGSYNNILVIGAETMTKIVNWEDRTTCVLFGDGAGAAVIGPVEGGRGILASTLNSYGAGGEWLYQPAGGSRKVASHETVENRLHTIHMQGKEVFKFAVKEMSDVALKVLDKAGLRTADIDLMVPHQANIRIIEAACKRLEVPMDRVGINLDRYGNISSASIPIFLDEAVGSGRIKAGDNVLLVAFGAGMTSGASVLRW